MKWTGNVNRGLHKPLQTSWTFTITSCSCLIPTLAKHLRLHTSIGYFNVFVWFLATQSLDQQEIMDESLPDHEAITVPVPTVILAFEDRYKEFPTDDICHVVVQWVSFSLCSFYSNYADDCLQDFRTGDWTLSSSPSRVFPTISTNLGRSGFSLGRLYQRPFLAMKNSLNGWMRFESIPGNSLHLATPRKKEISASKTGISTKPTLG